MHLVSKVWILFFFRLSKQGPCFTAVEEDGGNKKLAALELEKLMVLHSQILFGLAIAVIAETIMIPTSAEQVPFSHGVAGT